MENLSFRCSLKGELLKRVAQRFPDVDTDAVKALTLLHSVDTSLSSVLNEPLAEHKLSEGKFFILMYLFSEEIVGEEPPSPSEIAESLGVTRATITGLLDGLERDGFVERRHHSVDRRVLSIAMTEKTRAFLDVFAPAQAEKIKRLLSPLSAEEKQTLMHLLAKIDPN